jgi:hypothetical protein
MGELTAEALEYFRQKGREGGLKRARNLTPDRIKELSRLAGKGNQGKPKKQKEQA